MPYLLTTVEATQPPATIELSPEHVGIAVDIRHRGRPVGFWMKALPSATRISAVELAKQLEREAGRRILEEQIRSELEPSPAAGTLPDLSIAVCTRNRSQSLERCLRAIDEAIDRAAGRVADVEVLVVENAGSGDETRLVASGFSRTRYLTEPRPGLDFARNRALEAARGTLIAFVDDDVVVDRDWLVGLADAWSAHPDAGGFTGLVLPLALDTRAQVLFEHRGGFRRGFDRIRFNPSMPDDPLYPCAAGVFGTGANMAFMAELVRRIGGFDEALDAGASMPGGGDLDMFYRVVSAGHAIVYEPAFAVYHEHRTDLGELHRQYARSWGMSLMAFIAKIYRHEPTERGKLRKIVLLWYRTQAGRLVARLRGEPSVPVRTILAEAWGGMVGLAGAYTRAVRRAAAIREAHR